ncbi:lysozyme [Glaesserella sp.]|uniref:lysozyme n=1 Tax=Glaesserella sp. TaxID=2094731 RepID=UPI00359FE79F
MSRLKSIGSGCSIIAIITLMLAEYGTEIRSTERGLSIIGNAEGCKRDPYYCPAGVLTVGVGSTAAGGDAIQRKRYSDEEIAKRWLKDVAMAEKCVFHFANGEVLPLSVFEATTSIVFNVGCNKAKQSTLFKRLNAGQYKQACDEFTKWVYAGGKKLRGLEIRREQERKLCLTDLAKS